MQGVRSRLELGIVESLMDDREVSEEDFMVSRIGFESRDPWVVDYSCLVSSLTAVEQHLDRRFIEDLVSPGLRSSAE